MLNHGASANAGWYGYEWSSISSEYVRPFSATAYFANFDPNNIYPTDRGHRWYGFPVRCLVY